ncbi:hypothetical protein [Undibacterium sp. RuTC16W]|uniref:hypothetical protein n=1 Tax=Undibacterium sp. RuTC16W TaxID=3413048 RepID=UPI003BF3439F
MNKEALAAIVARQKPGAKFVVSAEMLGMNVVDFDLQAKLWAEENGPGFTTTGVPFRKVIDGQFFNSKTDLTEKYLICV